MTDDEIRALLCAPRTFAVVGASLDPTRPSHSVSAFLHARGHAIHGVNPVHAGADFLERPIRADLASVPLPIDVVDIFRRPAHVPGIVAAAIVLVPRPKVIWMQLGVVSEEAARIARDAGMAVVMDRCPRIEWARLAPRSGDATGR